MVRIRSVKALNNYSLYITFEDGINIEYNVKHRINHPAFKELQDKELFKNVTTDGFCLHWTDSTEICIDDLKTLYNKAKES